MMMTIQGRQPGSSSKRAADGGNRQCGEDARLRAPPRTAEGAVRGAEAGRVNPADPDSDGDDRGGGENGCHQVISHMTPLGVGS